jgi:hypothetical protein
VLMITSCLFPEPFKYMTARAKSHRFGLLRALPSHTKAP